MILCAKLDFQISNPAVISAEGLTLEASKALLKRLSIPLYYKNQNVTVISNQSVSNQSVSH